MSAHAARYRPDRRFPFPRRHRRRPPHGASGFIGTAARRLTRSGRSPKGGPPTGGHSVASPHAPRRPMLFNSFVFLLAFLPAALALHALVEPLSAAACGLPAARPAVVRLLRLVGLALRAAARSARSWQLARRAGLRPPAGRWLIPAAIAANLARAGACSSTRASSPAPRRRCPGVEAPRFGWVLPLGISLLHLPPHHVPDRPAAAAARRPSG